MLWTIAILNDFWGVLSHDHSETIALPPFYMLKTWPLREVWGKYVQKNIDLAMIIILTTFKFGAKLKPSPKFPAIQYVQCIYVGLCTLQCMHNAFTLCTLDIFSTEALLSSSLCLLGLQYWQVRTYVNAGLKYILCVPATTEVVWTGDLFVQLNLCLLSKNIFEYCLSRSDRYYLRVWIRCTLY